MNLEVTQDNLYLFLPGLMSNASCILAEQTNKNILDCIREIYLSDEYKEIEIAATKKWQTSPIDLATNLSPFARL